MSELETKVRQLMADYQIDDILRVAQEIKSFDKNGASRQRRCYIYQSHSVDGKSYADLAAELGITKSRIYQIYQTHARQLRHPSRLRGTSPPPTGCACKIADVDR